MYRPVSVPGVREGRRVHGVGHLEQGEYDGTGSRSQRDLYAVVRAVLLDSFTRLIGSPCS